MKKYLLLVLFILFILSNLFSQQNKIFLNLERKELATFSDGISLLRLFYDEQDTSAKFTDNLLWAVEKKLFQVTIPIKPDTINPILTRGEFAFWICKVFNGNKGLVNTSFLSRYSAFKTCTSTNILPEGRGINDSMTGKELLSIFNYLDSYVRANKIKAGNSKVLAVEEGYQNLPQWRAQLYKELDEQRAKEKTIVNKNKKAKPEKVNNNIKEKFIDKEDLSITR